MTMRCDLIIRDATIFDGTGAARVQGDVAVKGERIIGVGDLGAWSADREIEATGRAVAPGFIDAHTHDDRAVLCGSSCMLCKMSQGVTTVVVGNCGISLSPVRMKSRPIPPLDLLGGEEWWTFDSFGEYAERLAIDPAPVNTVALIGHMSLRVEAMDGDVKRAASDKEANAMQSRLRQALREGASGFSTGLYYPASHEAPTDEVIAVAEALRETGGLYVTHMRDEGDGVLQSIEETLKIGASVNAPVVISHHKCVMPWNFGRSRETLAAIDAAQARQKVDFDVYPYNASSTVLMPEKLHPKVPVRLAWSVPHPELAGRWLHDIAAEWGVDQVEAARRLLPAGAIYFQIDEDDMRRILSHPRAMVGSDGLPHDVFPHPRLWGTFPRVLGHYARDIGLFSLEAAVHKMTGRVADVFGLIDRGVIRPGAMADLVLFDPATVRDTADFDTPSRPADGIVETWVAGQSAYVHGKGATEARAGRLVTRGVSSLGAA
jgi:N-acyl-D-amino-acid deacylase